MIEFDHEEEDEVAKAIDARLHNLRERLLFLSARPNDEAAVKRQIQNLLSAHHKLGKVSAGS